MKAILLALVALSLAVGPAAAQLVPPPAKSDRQPVEHGAQPNTGEVRLANPDGDAPSAAAGDLVTRQERRILGLPITTALVLAGLVVALLVVAGGGVSGADPRQPAPRGRPHRPPPPRLAPPPAFPPPAAPPPPPR